MHLSSVELSKVRTLLMPQISLVTAESDLLPLRPQVSAQSSACLFSQSYAALHAMPELLGVSDPVVNETLSTAIGSETLPCPAQACSACSSFSKGTEIIGTTPSNESKN